jgi:DHA2 family multidrug resistance protein
VGVNHPQPGDRFRVLKSKSLAVAAILTLCYRCGFVYIGISYTGFGATGAGLSAYHNRVNAATWRHTGHFRVVVFGNVAEKKEYRHSSLSLWALFCFITFSYKMAGFNLEATPGNFAALHLYYRALGYGFLPFRYRVGSFGG